MKITHPHDLIIVIDPKRLQSFLSGRTSSRASHMPEYVKPPGPTSNDELANPPVGNTEQESSPVKDKSTNGTSASSITSAGVVIRGRIQRLGDFINTDDIIPNDAITATNFGEHCLKYTQPNFRRLCKEGNDIVVAGKAFGCGSSREVAVDALQGAGVQCIFAQSYSFIFGRNAPNLGLLAITMKDPAFFEISKDGVSISIELDKMQIEVGDTDGKTTWFDFVLSPMELRLLDCGGIAHAWTRWRRGLWDELVKAPKSNAEKIEMTLQDESSTALEW